MNNPLSTRDISKHPHAHTHIYIFFHAPLAFAFLITKHLFVCLLSVRWLKAMSICNIVAYLFLQQTHTHTPQWNVRVNDNEFRSLWTQSNNENCLQMRYTHPHIYTQLSYMSVYVLLLLSSWQFANTGQGTNARISLGGKLATSTIMPSFHTHTHTPI